MATPRRADPDAVAEDVREGYISGAAATRCYGYQGLFPKGT